MELLQKKLKNRQKYNTEIGRFPVVNNCFKLLQMPVIA